MEVNCRLACQDDLPGLLALIPQGERNPQAAGAQVATIERAHEIFDEMARQGNTFIFVATITEKAGLAGTCTMTLAQSLAYGGRPSATIETVVVAAHLRGRGIGKQLLAHAIEHAREAGCYKAQLITRGRPDQVAFYRRVGFSWEGVGFKAYFTGN